MFIVTSIPRDRSRLPQVPELDAIVITHLYSLSQCEECGQDIWIGPRSKERLDALRAEGSPVLSACFECAVNCRPARTVDLGGGASVEGVPRT